MGASAHITPLSALKSKSITRNRSSLPTFKRQQTIVLRKYRRKYPVVNIFQPENHTECYPTLPLFYDPNRGREMLCLDTLRDAE